MVVFEQTMGVMKKEAWFFWVRSVDEKETDEAVGVRTRRSDTAGATLERSTMHQSGSSQSIGHGVCANVATTGCVTE